MAAWFLSQLGNTIVGRNITVGRGEIDLLMTDGRRRFVVEVRSLVGSNQPLDAVTDVKRDQVRSLANQLGVARCDAVGVGLLDGCVIIHWDPDSF